MPITKSAKKRMRQTARLRVRNLDTKTEIKTIRSGLFEAISSKDKDAGARLYRDYCSALDKAAKKGIIKGNTASRRKTRAAAQVKAL
jgi:small subunit ribosomal protein S20